MEARGRRSRRGRRRSPDRPARRARRPAYPGRASQAGLGGEEQPMDHPSSELKNTGYELFIGALSVLSIGNLAILVLVNLTGQDPVVANITYIIDAPLSLIFLGDFAYRLKTARSRGRYFFRQWGWADLVASLPLPQFKILRLS